MGDSVSRTPLLPTWNQQREAWQAVGAIARVLCADGYRPHDVVTAVIHVAGCCYSTAFGHASADTARRALMQDGTDNGRLADQIREAFVASVASELRQGLGPLLSSARAVHFGPRARELLRRCWQLDWRAVHPSLFGMVYQLSMDPRQRRHVGAHYTPGQTIHKVLGPLFVEQLRQATCDPAASTAKLQAVLRDVSTLTLLDPACGCGYFLLAAYEELLRVEATARHRLAHSSGASPGRHETVVSADVVKLSQFYGIECDALPCAITRLSLWLLGRLMRPAAALAPRCSSSVHEGTAKITHGNALALDWTGVCDGKTIDYIVGNPPFVGARRMSTTQKRELRRVFGKTGSVGNLDYVAGWFRKAADVMARMPTRTGFVATSSITQGDQVGILWKELLAAGTRIDFAHRAFRWDSPAAPPAAVHCVALGLSGPAAPTSAQSKRLFDIEQGAITVRQAHNISPYLVDAPNTVVTAAHKPLCDAPAIGIGNKPVDGGHYLFTQTQMEAFLRDEPKARALFRPWYGTYEFVHRRPRYCLLLRDIPDELLAQLPLCRERIEAVRAFRLRSKSPGTVKLAEHPTHFHVTNIPTSTYLLIPELTSTARDYIPIGFMNPHNLASSLVRIIAGASLYHFGVLTSRTHMLWMQATAGRLGAGYRYSKDIVYNNFPWPGPVSRRQSFERGRAERWGCEPADRSLVMLIEQCAKEILAVRERHAELSYRALYSPDTMPRALRQAHEANDHAVWLAYEKAWPEQDAGACVAWLMTRYDALRHR